MTNLPNLMLASNLKLDDTVNFTFYSAIVCAVIIIALMLDTIVRFNKGIKDKHKKSKKTIIGITSVIAIASVLVMITLNASYAVAQKHGAYTRDITIESMYYGISHSPVESTLPETLEPGAIIIYYRFDCPDCHAIYEDLMRATENVDNIYFVSSRSEQGKALIELYPVNEVPSGIYLRTYTYNGAIEFTRKILYYTDANGNVVFDQANFNRLLELREENK